MTAAVSLILLLFVGYAGLAMNRSALSIERRLIDKEIERAVVGVLEQQKSVALWDDAIPHARAHDRSWLDSEIGSYLADAYGHDAVYLLDERDRPIYDYHRRNSPQFTDAVHIAAPLLRSIRLRVPAALRARGATFKAFEAGQQHIRGASDFGFAANLLNVDGHPAIISVITLIPTDDMRFASRRPLLLLSVVELTPARLATLGEAAIVKDLVLTPGNGAGPGMMPLVADDGAPIGQLTWTPHDPGHVLLTIALPLLMVGTGWATFGSWALLRRLVSASRQLRTGEAEARVLALQDTVSGLPNRRAFAAALDQRLAGWRAGDLPRPALAYVDLDHFKDVNDTLGHATGDGLVLAVAERLRSAMPPDTALARLGGDEFAVIAPAADAVEVKALAQRLCALFEAPFAFQGHGIGVSASIGIALAPDRGASAGGMTRHADIALYRAKEAGRGRAVVFRPEMERAIQRRRIIETALGSAIADNELRLVYQPVRAIDEDGPFRSAEALLRWDHPELGAIPPDSFISIAEASGQMNRLGDWVIERALADMARWPAMEVAINLSPTQLRLDGFVSHLHAMTVKAGVDPRQIILEVTESVLLDATEQMQHVIDALRASGFRVALDDFGTGFSSLSYLARIRFDRLKIDRTLIEGVGENPAATAVMETAIALGRRLGLEVVAEGVETAAQAALMRVAGCTHLQGYHIAMPLEPAAIAAGSTNPATARARA